MMMKHKDADEKYKVVNVVKPWIKLDDGDIFNLNGVDFTIGEDGGYASISCNDGTMENIRELIHCKQLDEHLAKQQSDVAEWKNDDELYFKTDACYGRYIGFDSGDYHIIETENAELKSVHIDTISKPLTEQQKKEQERLKAAIELHDFANKKYFKCDILTPSQQWDKADHQTREMWLSIVDKTGYKGE